MIENVKNAVVAGKLKNIEGLVQESIDAGSDPAEIVDSMISAMDVIGGKFQRNEIYIPEMLIAAKTMQRGMNVLTPLLSGGDTTKRGKCIIGTVAGDLHDIGKNLVAMMIESAGFEVIDLGVDVPAVKFVEVVKENPDCQIVALSALLTTTLPALRDAVQALIDAGVKSQVKILVGGAPVTQELADEIGADAYTTDAGAAAAKAKELVG